MSAGVGNAFIPQFSINFQLPETGIHLRGNTPSARFRSGDEAALRFHHLFDVAERMARKAEGQGDGMTTLEEARILVADALERPVDEIAPDDALGAVPGWDSLGHMRIVLGLESYLKRMLAADEVISLKSVPDIAALLEKHYRPEG